MPRVRAAVVAICAAGLATASPALAVTLTPVKGLPSDGLVTELTPSPSGNSAIVTTLLGGRVGIFSISDSRDPVPLGTRTSARIRSGASDTRTFISTDGLVVGWSLPGDRSFVVATVDGGSVRRLRPPGAGGELSLWLAPGGNTVVARRGPVPGIWRAGATERTLRPVTRRAAVPLHGVLFATSPRGDGFGTCAEGGGRVAVAGIRARARSLQYVTSRPGLASAAFSRCATADGGRAVATLAADRSRAGFLFATVRGGVRTIRIPGLTAGRPAHMAFMPGSTTLVIDDGDARCQGRDVWIVDLTTGGVRRVRTPSGMCGPVSASANGRTIAARSPDAIHVINVPDGRVSTTGMPRGASTRPYSGIRDVRVSADGARVTFQMLVAGRGADMWSVAANARGGVNLTPANDWVGTTRTFVIQSLDGSHAWTNVASARRDPLLAVPVRDFARSPFTPPG
jgi:hypothetical protein